MRDKELLQLIKKLKTYNKTTDIIHELKQIKDKRAKLFICMVYDKQLRFGTARKHKIIKLESTVFGNVDILNQLEFFKYNRYFYDSSSKFLTMYRSFTLESRALVNMMVNKSLGLNGVNYKLIINNIYKELDYQVMFASGLTISHVVEKIVKCPFICQPSETGFRVYLLFKNNKLVSVRSKLNAFMPQRFVDYLNLMGAGNIKNDRKDFAIDCKINFKRENGSILTKKECLQVIKKVLTNTFTESDLKGIYFRCWDILSLEQIKNSDYIIYRNYESVHYELEKTLVEIKDIFQTTPLRKVSNTEQMYEYLLSENKPIVMKAETYGWCPKPSYNIIQVKELHTVDLIVDDIIPATNKSKKSGTLKHIVCVSKDKTIRIELTCGIGDILARNLIMKNKSKYIGKVIRVLFLNFSNKNNVKKINLLLFGGFPNKTIHDLPDTIDFSQFKKRKMLNMKRDDLR